MAATRAGYLPTILGSVVGGIVLLVAGVAFGVSVASDGLEGLVWPVVMGLLGVGFGAGGGAWLALKLRGHRGSLSTAIPIGGVAPLVAIAALLAAERLAGRGDDATDEMWVAAILFVLSGAVLAITVRAIVTRARGGDWDAPPNNAN